MDADRAAASRRKPLTNEMLRILLAVRDDRLVYVVPTGRYTIPDHDRPARRDRVLLAQRGYIQRHSEGGAFDYELTELGKEALHDVGFDA